MQGEVSSHNLDHVVLAYRDLVCRELAEEVLHPVYHNLPYWRFYLLKLVSSILILETTNKYWHFRGFYPAI